MPSNNYYATGALGLCMLVLPVMSQAQSSDAGAATSTDSSYDDTAIFVPLVDECVQIPNAETCGKVRAVVTECAEELERALCDVLFVEPDAVFDTQEANEEVQLMLFETSEAIAEMEFEDVNDAEIDGIVEGSRADAERTLLRGDENLMSHSGPPVVEEE